MEIKTHIIKLHQMRACAAEGMGQEMKRGEAKEVKEMS